jgi:hypothetical protein
MVTVSHPELGPKTRHIGGLSCSALAKIMLGELISDSFG